MYVLLKLDLRLYMAEFGTHNKVKVKVKGKGKVHPIIDHEGPEV